MELLMRDIAGNLRQRGEPELHSQLSMIKHDFDQKISDTYTDIEKYCGMLRDDVDKLSTALSTALAKKADNRDIDRIG